MTGKRIISKKKLIRNAIIVTLAAMMLALGTLVVFAYYSSQVRLYTADGDTKTFKMGMELNTFFDELSGLATYTDLGIKCTDTSLAKTTKANDADTSLTYTTVNGVNYYTYNKSAPWGSASNPYIISKTNHLQNLYVLQNCGYFEYYYEGGKVTEDCMPYFLVCDNIGQAVVIEGENKVFEYIGNDAHPFIGYVGGAFASETTVEVDGKTCDQSVIHKITVKTATDVTDVGLFGRIGYLGDESSANDNGAFAGSVSTITDILLYDVNVVVEEKDAWTALVDATAHLFSFSKYDTEAQTTLPHENHHVGILAGHVEYATIQNISVYYSDDSLAAIDVKQLGKSTNGMSANFKSISGILGYVYNMNALQADKLITIGGISDGDIEVSNGGVGTGGGLASGEGRGYVTAKEIYEMYHKSGVIVKLEAEGHDPKYGLLVDRNETNLTFEVDGTTITTAFSLPDGTPIEIKSDTEKNAYYVLTYTSYRSFTNSERSLSETWYNFIVHDLTKVGTSEEYYYIVGGANNNTNVYATSVTTTGVSLKYAASIDQNTNEYDYLCTQYVRERIGSIFISSMTQITNRFYFYDGVFTFAISEATDTIEPTWDSTGDKLVVGQDDDSKWTQDESALPNSVVAFLKPIKTEEELLSGKEIFIAYKEGNNYHIVTLAGNSAYNSGSRDNAVTTPKTTLSSVSDDLRTTLKESLDAGTLTLDKSSYIKLEELEQSWNDIVVLDLTTTGSTGLTLEQLRSAYQVKVSSVQKDPTSGTYEEDGVTGITTALKNNMNVDTTGKYYVVSGAITGTSKGATEISTAEEYGTNFQLFTFEGYTEVNLSNVYSAISKKNSTLYENSAGTVELDSTLRSKIDLNSSGTQISQTEYNYYKNGYYYFDTKDQWDGLLHYCYFRLKRVYADGTVSSELTSTKIWWVGLSSNTAYSTIKDLFSKTEESDGLLFGTYNSVKLPVLYELGGTYYTAWERDTGSSNFIEGKTKASLSNNIISTEHTAYYNYIVATETGSGTVYTWNGLTVSCSNVSKYSTVANAAQYDTKTLYGKNYDLYTCNKGDRAIMVYRYQIDGVILQTMTGSGAEVKLLNSSGNKSDITLPLTDTGKTITADGKTFKLYKTANGKLGVRVANIKIDGYFTANQKTGQETTYKLKDTTALLTIPQKVTGLTYSVSNGTTSKAYNLYVADGKYLAFMLIHEEKNQQYIYRFWHTNLTAGGEDYVLRILRRTYTIGEYYSMVVGTNTYVDNVNNFGIWAAPCHSVYSNPDCTVILNGDGTAYLQYTQTGNTRYLSYSTSGNYFTTATSQNTASRLYLFTSEGTHDSSIGEHIVPIAGTEVASYNANECVLWPNNTYVSTDTATSTYKPVKNGYTTDTSYSVIELSKLGTAWKNKSGVHISEAKTDLNMVFSLGSGISDVQLYNLLGGNTSLTVNNDKYVKAPIGSNGEESYIPTGCVAFKINKSGANNKIRVIVAVPVSDYFYGQLSGSDYLNPSSSTGLDYSQDYCFCMWKIDEANSNRSFTFAVDNCYEAFELPRSNSYDTTKEAMASQTYSNISGNSLSATGTNVKKYINVTMNGNTYRAYLNGNQILVAYEFDAKEEGVYLLGSTKECRIVYFSADAAASTGNDGTSSYKLGTIDFVYDNGSNKIITVKDTAPSTVITKDYSNYYYASLSLLYTDTANAATNGPLADDTDVTSYGGIKYANINDFQIFVRRAVSDSAPVLSWNATGGTSYSSGVADAAYIQFVRYSYDADGIARGADSVRTP